ncbi:MAG: hypothetical protein WCQ87_10435 [Parabacteroides sp.]
MVNIKEAEDLIRIKYLFLALKYSQEIELLAAESKIIHESNIQDQSHVKAECLAEITDDKLYCKLSKIYNQTILSSGLLAQYNATCEELENIDRLIQEEK